MRNKRYAKIIIDLPVEGPFDYYIPKSLVRKVKLGKRVEVPFRDKNRLGYIVGFTKRPKVKHIKRILQVLDEKPILDREMLKLTKSLSEYYLCSWGEIVETAILKGLK